VKNLIDHNPTLNIQQQIRPALLSWVNWPNIKASRTLPSNLFVVYAGKPKEKIKQQTLGKQQLKKHGPPKTSPGGPSPSHPAKHNKRGKYYLLWSRHNTTPSSTPTPIRKSWAWRGKNKTQDAVVRHIKYRTCNSLHLQQQIISNTCTNILGPLTDKKMAISI